MGKPRGLGSLTALKVAREREFEATLEIHIPTTCYGSVWLVLGSEVS